MLPLILNHQKKLVLILFLIVVIIAILLRFNNLSNFPAGMNQDETAIGYNAYSILQTGRDEHGVKFPLYFKSFNDYKLPAYIYTTVISESILGVNTFAVRFPSALAGVVTVFAFYFLIKLLTRNEWLALIGALFLAINPWNLFFSRVALEVNLAVCFEVLGTLFFVLAAEKKRLIFYLFSVVAFVIALYSYNITRFHAPLLLLSLVVIYRKQFKELSLAKIFSLGIVFLILISPFIFTFFKSSGLHNETNVTLLGGNAKAAMVEMRSYLTPLPHILSALFFNSFFLLIWEYCRNIANSFSTTFFFYSLGSTNGDVGVGNVGAFYPVDLFFMIVGLYFLSRKVTKSAMIFFSWAAILILIVGFSSVVPHGTRSYPLVIPLIFFSAYGFYVLIGLLSKINKTYLRLFIILVSIIVVYSFLYFQASYYYRFPKYYAAEWRVTDKPLSLYLQSVAPNYSHIIIDTNTPFIYTSLAFYQKYSPKSFQKEVIYQQDSLFTSVESLGKYQFRKIDWSKDVKDKHNLLVAASSDVPANIHVIKTFYYPTRPVVLSLQNNIAQYPYTKPVVSVISQ